MDRIESYEQCAALIRDFKRSCDRTVTNFYFLPGELKEIIGRERIRFRLSSDTLIFYVEEQAYCCVYYFLAEKAIPVLPKMGKPVILDFVARGEAYTKAEGQERERWHDSGFEPYKVYVRMQYPVSLEEARTEGALQRIGYTCSCAEDGDAGEIAGLWQESLDRFSTPLPDAEEVRRMIRSRHVYCMKTEGEIAGAVYMDVAADTCVLKHLAVASIFRGQGLGMVIMDHALRSMARENVRLCRLWVAHDNTAAYRSYIGYGFQEDGLKSGRLICRE